MNADAVDALHEYAEALCAYARCPQSIPYHYSPTNRPSVVTESEPGSFSLPTTGRPVRGLSGVRVVLKDTGPQAKVERDALQAVLWEAIPFSASGPSDPAADVPCGSERRRLYEAFTRLRHTLFAEGDLALRLLDGVGYKTHGPSELPSRLLDSLALDFPFMEISALGDLFRGQVAALGGDAQPAGAFDEWRAVVEGVVKTLSELETRQNHLYEARAYLNAPVCDFEGSKLLLGRDDSTAFSVSIAQATDHDLSTMIEGYGYAAQLPPGLYDCNTVLRIPLSAPVLGTLESFESLYPMAAELAARVLDVFRIVFGEDIGICALTLESTQFGAPTIRQKYHHRFNPAFGPYLPQRFAFPSVTDRVITDEELRGSSSLLARHVADTKVKGFGVALRRFRDTWDRHWPDSPERLLDIAIALEALFLNDGEDKELRHRLALRVARFLEEPGPRRLEVFRAVRQLYDLRSKVAHGASLQEAPRALATKLSATMTDAPAILRSVMRRMIEGSGPTGLDGNALAEYWRQIELA